MLKIGMIRTEGSDMFSQSHSQQNQPPDFEDAEFKKPIREKKRYTVKDKKSKLINFSNNGTKNSFNANSPMAILNTLNQGKLKSLHFDQFQVNEKINTNPSENSSARLRRSTAKDVKYQNNSSLRKSMP